MPKKRGRKNKGFFDGGKSSSNQSRGNHQSSSNIRIELPRHDNTAQMSKNSEYYHNTNQSYNGGQMSSNVGYYNSTNQPMANFGSYSNNNNQNAHHSTNQPIANFGVYGNNPVQNPYFNNSNMNNQSLNPWVNASPASCNNSHYTNYIAHDYNHGSYSNNVVMSHSTVMTMNQVNQYDQSSVTQNSPGTIGITDAWMLSKERPKDALDALNRQQYRNRRDRDNKKDRNDQSGNDRSQTLVTIKNQFIKESNLSPKNKLLNSVKGFISNKKKSNFSPKKKPLNSVKDRTGKKNANKSLKRLGNNISNKNKNKSLKQFGNNVSTENANKSLKRHGNKTHQSKKYSIVNDRDRFDNIDILPTEYLKCHMCNKLHFTSVDNYLQHCKGKSHWNMGLIYHEKCKTTLQMLRLDSALASQRIIDESQNQNVSNVGINMCPMCECSIPLNRREHNNTIEHKMVVKYLTVECCEKEFNNREDLEEHKLSLAHLKQIGDSELRDKNQMEAELEDIKALDHEKKSPIEQEKALHIKADQVLKDVEVEEQVYSISTLPPYDSYKAIGKIYVVSKQCFMCLVCNDFFHTGKQSLEIHCRSSNHYQNIINFLEGGKGSGKFMNREERLRFRNYTVKKTISENVIEKKMKEDDSLQEEPSKANKDPETILDIKRDNHTEDEMRLLINETKNNTLNEDSEDERSSDLDLDFLLINDEENETINESCEDLRSSDNDLDLDEIDIVDIDLCNVHETIDDNRNNEEWMNITEEKNINNEVYKEKNDKEKKKIGCTKESSSSKENPDVLIDLILNNKGSNLKDEESSACKNKNENIEKSIKKEHKGSKKQDDVNNENICLKRKREEAKTCNFDYMNKKDESEDLQTNKEEEREFEEESKSKSKLAMIADEHNYKNESVSEDDENEIGENKEVYKKKQIIDSDDFFRNKDISEKESGMIKKNKEKRLNIKKEPEGKSNGTNTTDDIMIKENENEDLQIDKKKEFVEEHKGKSIREKISEKNNDKREFDCPDENEIFEERELHKKKENNNADKIYENKEFNIKKGVNNKREVKKKKKVKEKEENEKKKEDKEKEEVKEKVEVEEKEEGTDKEEVEMTKTHKEEKNDREIKEIKKKNTAVKTEVSAKNMSSRRSSRQKSNSQ